MRNFAKLRKETLALALGVHNVLKKVSFQIPSKNVTGDVIVAMKLELNSLLHYGKICVILQNLDAIKINVDSQKNVKKVMQYILDISGHFKILI